MGKIPDKLKHREIIKCIQKGKYIGNRNCHVNCLSYAHRHPEKVVSIIGVAQIMKDDDCVAHFILKMDDGTYFDPTYGNMSGILDSYHIQIEEYKIENFSPDRELYNLKEYLYNLNPWLWRLFNRNHY